MFLTHTFWKNHRYYAYRQVPHRQKKRRKKKRISVISNWFVNVVAPALLTKGTLSSPDVNYREEKTRQPHNRDAYPKQRRYKVLRCIIRMLLALLPRSCIGLNGYAITIKRNQTINDLFVPLFGRGPQRKEEGNRFAFTTIKAAERNLLELPKHLPETCLV